MALTGNPMKHLLLSIFVLCTLKVSLSAAGLSDLSYVIEEGSAIITDCDQNASGELVIPHTIEGYPVSAIGQNAFDFCSRLTSVTAPIASSVSTIQLSAIAAA